MKIFIPCAGIGSRLEYLTKNLNKSLVTINDKPAISHIIEKFSKEHTFVIALGFKGDLLKQFLLLAYPDRCFEFVEVHNFDGEGSGLGLTISCCEQELQEPFLFIPTDSLFEESEDYLIQNSDSIFFSESIDDEFQYRKVEISSGKLLSINEKKHRGLIYTGICHIKDFKRFWKNVSLSPEFILIGESFVLNKLAGEIKINCLKLTWTDIGNLKSLERVKNKVKSKFNILDKENEAIWFVNDFVIKYHENESFISNRVKRFAVLDTHTPNLISFSKNMYKYEFIKGKTLSETLDLSVMKDLIDYLNKFWKKTDIDDIDCFKNACLKFYKDKTLKRLQLYKSISPNDCEVINGINVGSIESIFENIDWDWLSNGMPFNFHGDLHFENILKTADSFRLLDWRQDFEDNIFAGDIYYDFAKLLHGMIIAHDIVKKELYTFNYIDSNSVYFDVCVKNINILAQEIFFKYLKNNGYDIKKVKILTALIFLNIAPLHHEPYNHLLYYLGKLQLHNILEE